MKTNKEESKRKFRVIVRDDRDYKHYRSKSFCIYEDCDMDELYNEIKKFVERLKK